MNPHDRGGIRHTPDLFEALGLLDDQNVWDLLEILYALIDAYEGYYAEPLQRLRAQRHRDIHEPDPQLRLPLKADEWDDEF